MSTIHTDPEVQHIDVRIYFGPDVDQAEMLDNVSTMIQDSEMSCYMLAAHQLIDNGNGHLLPDIAPLA